MMAVNVRLGQTGNNIHDTYTTFVVIVTLLRRQECLASYAHTNR